jgi:glycogenin glucosyltransferase
MLFINIMTAIVVFIFASLLYSQAEAFRVNPRDHALVTLISGERSGYEYGAVALGESLKLVGSKMKRIALVTPEVDEIGRSLLSIHWEVREVEPIYCVAKTAEMEVPVDKELYPEDMRQDLRRFEPTCSKFHAWRLTEFKRVMFMDSDLVVLHPIDDALYKYSNASFVAAPECFPPDTFNSGLMVFTPSMETFEFLVKSNERNGSVEGGDQGVFNRNLCPNWFFANSDDPHCGRLPWGYNVEAQYYGAYKSYVVGYGEPEAIRVLHYINDGKPWKTLYFDQHFGQIPMTSMIQQLSTEAYAATHLYWRFCFLRATGMRPPERSIYYERWSDVLQRKGMFARISEVLFDDSPNFQVEGVTAISVGSHSNHRMRVVPPSEFKYKGPQLTASNIKGTMKDPTSERGPGTRPNDRNDHHSSDNYDGKDVEDHVRSRRKAPSKAEKETDAGGEKAGKGQRNKKKDKKRSKKDKK